MAKKAKKRSPKHPPPIPPPPPRTSLGDCTLKFTADITDLNKCVTDTIQRLKKALTAFEREWKRKKSASTPLKAR